MPATSVPLPYIESESDDEPGLPPGRPTFDEVQADAAKRAYADEQQRVADRKRELEDEQRHAEREDARAATSEDREDARQSARFAFKIEMAQLTYAHEQAMAKQIIGALVEIIPALVHAANPPKPDFSSAIVGAVQAIAPYVADYIKRKEDEEADGDPLDPDADPDTTDMTPEEYAAWAKARDCRIHTFATAHARRAAGLAECLRRANDKLVDAGLEPELLDLAKEAASAAGGRPLDAAEQAFCAAVERGDEPPDESIYHDTPAGTGK
jgi:hypothetical protein